MSKEAIALLEKAKTRYGDSTNRLIDQALEILVQPECDTCGDNKRIIEKEGQFGLGHQYIPCPDCQQPIAGEFTKECRNKLEIYTNLEDERTFTIKDEDEILELFLKLCGRLDRETFEHLQIQQATEVQFNAKLDRAEAINKDLLEAFRELAATFVGLPEGSIGGQAMKKANEAIAKAKKEAEVIEKKHGGCWPEAKKEK